MNQHHWKPRKVVIVGAGNVGSTYAFTLALRGLADEIVLIDANRDFAKGQALDMMHGQAFFPSIQIREGGPADYTDAALIVITAGAKQQPGETRLSLVQRNAIIIKSCMDEIVAAKSEAVVLIVSNPVDILTYVAHKVSGWPRGRVIGSGTVLDSARFRHLLAQRCNVDVHNVHAHIMGEHGDSEFAAWSITNMAGMPIDHYCETCEKCPEPRLGRDEIVAEVRNSAYHVIGYKGATWFAVALALADISTSILRNHHSVLTVSAVLDGEYGEHGVALGVPSLMSWRGVDTVLQVDLPEEEAAALHKSAATLRDIIASIDIPELK
ncbi:L-lactate dehydrogenase [Rhizomicrobium palustre]|uniref:L-lactate dehydrogenase n=1 Tax=Rhizomicrobium palustre TaxID=189966 RepID=A0A846MVS6_9PROT|nr:L-lactate dehydrogenase [Rhizomicrobium palustre]